MRWRWLLSTVPVLLAAAGVAPAQSALKPAGGSSTFGAAPDQAFTSGSIFAPAKLPPPPSVVAVQAVEVVPLGAGADGGLFPERVAPPPPKIWSGSAETGLNGASGNAELFNFRAAAGATRKTADNVFTADFLYTYTEANKLTTLQQALFNARDEVLIAGTPYSLFASTNVEYDELRAYKFRVGIYAGVGYTVIDDADLTFKVRAGAGAVRELGSGGLADRWVPEAVFGYDFKYQINDRSSFLSVLDFYPRIDDWSKFRVRARFGYEHVLDPANGLVLRLGLQDRFDSDPGTAKRNDVTYFMTLGMKF